MWLIKKVRLSYGVYALSERAAILIFHGSRCTLLGLCSAGSRFLFFGGTLCSCYETPVSDSFFEDPAGAIFPVLL